MFASVSRFGLSAFVIGAMSLAGSLAYASEPGDGAGDDNRESTITVTESETTAKLKGQGLQLAARGYAESSSVTVTDSSTNTSTTKSKLTISVKKLSLADGSTVTFALNGNSLGTASVKKGKASLKLSTKKGDQVPAVNSGDTLTVVDPDGVTTDLSGAFGAVVSHTES